MNFDAHDKLKNSEASEVRQADLSPEVRGMIANVHAQIKEVTERYNVPSIQALKEKLESGNRRDLLAARGDLALLGRLAERMREIYRAHKEIEGAIGDRLQLTDVANKARAVLHSETIGDDLRPRLVMQILEADLATYGKSPDMMARLGSRLEFAEAEPEYAYQLFRSLGRQARIEDAEALWSGAVKGYDQQMKAAYATGLADINERDALLRESRDAIDPTTQTALGDLAAIADIERDAGLDVRETLTKISECRREVGTSAVEYDMKSLANLYAKLGLEGEMVSVIDLSVDISDVLEVLGIAYVQQGKIEDAKRVLEEIRESIEPTKLVCHLLPSIIKNDTWELLGMADEEEHMRFVEDDEAEYMGYLLEYYPNLVPVLYQQLLHHGIPTTPVTEAMYARFLATQKDERSREGVVERRADTLRAVDEALALYRKFQEELKTSVHANPWKNLGAALHGGLRDLEVPLAYHIIAACGVGESPSSLLRTLFAYVREANRKDDGSEEIAEQKYNRRMYNAVKVLADAGLYAEAEVCQGAMFPAGTGIEIRTASGQAIAYIYSKHLASAIVQEAASHDLLERASGS